MKSLFGWHKQLPDISIESKSNIPKHFAFVGVPIWPAAVVGVRADGSAARQSPTTSRAPALVARASQTNDFLSLPGKMRIFIMTI